MTLKAMMYVLNRDIKVSSILLLYSGAFKPSVIENFALVSLALTHAVIYCHWWMRIPRRESCERLIGAK